MHRASWIVLVIFLLALGTSAWQQPAAAPSAPAPTCAAELRPYVRTALYADRMNPNSRGGRISDREFRSFVDQVLVKHFPAGGTIIPNQGWWRAPNGKTDGAPGQTMVMLAPVAELESHRAAVRIVIAEYKQRYQQQSVLWEEDRVCAAF
ncbi:MAG TPA: DUF3574 domain-containing protein [Terriglobales bacterium]|nr:DUF3574 domain-containing protein [Terriglobales bacterium]